MSKKHDALGVMLVFSRNAVMALPSLKNFLPTIRKTGYNTVFLYTEDTYELKMSLISDICVKDIRMKPP